MKKTTAILLVLLLISLATLTACGDDARIERISEDIENLKQKSEYEKIELTILNYKKYIDIETYFSGFNTEYLETGPRDWRYYNVYCTCTFNAKRKINCNFENAEITLEISSSWSISDSTIKMTLGYDGTATKSLFVYKENYTPALSTLYPSNSDISVYASGFSGYVLVAKA